MSKLVRFGVSLEKELLKHFDVDIREKKYPNRSEAIRDLIRESLVKEEWVKGGEVAGAITLVYNHHRRELVNKLTDIQHDYHQLIISVQHIHLDEDNCLEIVVVKGKVNAVRKLADRLRATKGVKHTALTMSTTGKGVK
ncbi:MAG TPA: nickel-responsive transcriptional regulator NikR [Elusimicrobia bacterium]|jgi:CopG family nickel-responsive transcriptional regulator|nr:nickel-responsive transcriptional regulator NikR [Elusimicrobiota bacterium]